jgi:membrane dipeptidase
VNAPASSNSALRIPNPAELRPNKGFQPFLPSADMPYLFVDACMQAWPDADYANAHRHGATAIAVTAWRPDADLDSALEDGMFWHLVARKYPNTLIAYSGEDIRRARREQRIALIIAAQGGDFIGRKLHRIEAFYRLGLRIMLPAYNAANAICGGCLDRDEIGLTRFGELVVAECNRVGLLLDGSHVSRRATMEMMERTNQPFIFSHSNARALVDTPRNADDEQIKACARTGGVIGLANFGPFTKPAESTEWPSLDDFIIHIDHVAQLTGSIEHIGIGTDMSLGTYPDHWHDPWGEPNYPNPGGNYADVVTGDVRSPRRALSDFNCYPQVLNLADRLLAEGYADSDVHMILGGNFLRVFDEVWK